MELDWDYSKRTCCVSMLGYMEKVLACYVYQGPSNPELSPHQHYPISYDSKTQQPAATDLRPHLNAADIKRVQGIVCALLWYGHAINNRIIVATSAIRYLQAAATNATADSIH